MRSHNEASTLHASSLERLVMNFPDQEVWWDSSPLIFANWKRDLVMNETDPDRSSALEAQLTKLYDDDHPERSLLQGATTNPPLCLKAIQADINYWNDWIDGLGVRFQGSSRELFWRVYCEVINRSAEMLHPIFEASNYKRGYVSGQVDPRNLTDIAQMVKEALNLNAMRRNIMVKMPGTKEGIYGIRLLTSMGIPTNATLSFTVPQVTAVAEAVEEGLKNARANGIDLSRWRSVATLVLGRFAEDEEFSRQAQEIGIDLTEADRCWAGIAIVKQAYKIFKQRRYETKLLTGSMRLGPTINGKPRVWHVEKLMGGSIVFSMSPRVIEAFMRSYADEDISSRIEEDVPRETLDKLLSIPYFRQAYYEDGLKPEEFISYPAVVRMANSFIKATQDLEDYVAERARKARDRRV